MLREQALRARDVALDVTSDARQLQERELAGQPRLRGLALETDDGSVSHAVARQA